MAEKFLLSLYAPVLRIAPSRREVVVRATSEAIDQFGTRFQYMASKAAFERWLGNVREMHQPKAVGTCTRIMTDDRAKTIDVVLRISRGAEDTWQKVLDGTLKGASIGATDVVWQDGADGVPEAVAYELVEVSLVDRPANPDCRVLVLRLGQVEEGDMGTERRAEPENAITGGIESSENSITSVVPQAVGKLVLATTANPSAPDYGVPAEVSASATPGEDGARYTPVTGDFHEGGHAVAVLRTCGCEVCERAVQALAVEEMHESVSEVMGVLREEIARLTARVERLAAQPVAGGPVAMATRGFTALPVGEQIQTLQDFAVRSGDPAVQMAAAAAILQMQG